MKRLREKWNSSQGASILVALLLMLICMMVASSVLMAAASNAGKTTRNSLEEHQKYLTLSSALRLVCGEIVESSYQGAYYTYEPESVKKEVPVWKKDEYGNIIKDVHGDPIVDHYVEEHDYYLHTYEQKPGTYTSGLSNVLPLEDYMDYLFGKEGAKVSLKSTSDNKYTFSSSSQPGLPPPTELTPLTLTVEAPDFDPVTIKLSLNEFGYISLTASLHDDPDHPEDGGHVYTMEAELMPVSPSNNAPVSLNDVFALESTKGEHTTKTVSWKLNWIAKKKGA